MNNRAYHNSYRRLWAKLVDTYREQVYEALNAQGIDPENLDSTKLQETLMKLHTNAALVNAGKVLRSLKRKEAKSNNRLWQQVVEEFLLNGGLKIKGIIDTTRREIMKAIAEGQAQGLGTSAISRYVADRMKVVNRVRAELITRTELTGAMNFGSMMGALSFGYQTNKSWLSTMDDRTRLIPRNDYDHLHMNDVTVPLDGYFIVPSLKTIDAMQFPGDPSASAGNLCNCRCTVVYEPVRDAQDRLVPIQARPPQMGLAATIWNIMQGILAGVTVNNLFQTQE